MAAPVSYRFTGKGCYDDTYFTAVLVGVGVVGEKKERRRAMKKIFYADEALAVVLTSSRLRRDPRLSYTFWNE